MEDIMIGIDINGYKIIEAIGSGTFGHTYKAIKDDDFYAIKILKPEAMSNEIQSGGYKRFKREVRSLQKVNSEYVVKYYDSGVWLDKDIEHYYIVMEFIEGMDFNKFLNNFREKFLTDENQMKKVFSGILDGLFAIHNHSIIHRDLKPANIFITKDDNVKLLDFGLVKMLDYSTITTRGKIVGTPLFMSPEIIEGKSIDYRSDLFSFGVLLYHIFTNCYPFSGENIFVLLNNIVKKPPERISEKFKDISNPLENIILKLLEKQPYLRPFQNAHELKNVLNEIPFLKFSIDLENEEDKSFDRKKFFVRLMHNERTELSNFLKTGGNIDGVEYQANYLPKYGNQIKDLINFKTPYYFDPSTNRLIASKFTETKGLKELPYVYDKYSRLTPDKLSSIGDIKRYVKDVLLWQLKWKTDFLISPFHYSQNLADNWLSTDLKLVEEAFIFKSENQISRDIYAGICLDIEDLTDEENRVELINKFSRILPDGFIFYINNINEKNSNPSQLYSYIDLLLKFKKLKRPIIAARVGTLGLGLLELGIDAFSQGIASLSSFSAEMLILNRPFNYQMKRKYYFQNLLLTLNVQLAAEILNKFPELKCNCKFCLGKFDLASISKVSKSHFLELRSNEIQLINSNDLHFIDIIKKAKDNIKKVKKSNIKLPSTSHIDVWFDVFSEFLK